MVFEKQAGQVLLIVVVAFLVLSIVGFSLASRIITSQKTSTEEAESQKALAAAEAGIERAIQGNAPVGSPPDANGISIGVGGNLGSNTNYATQFREVNGSDFLIYGGNAVEKDEGADVWFVNHDGDGNPDYSSPTIPTSLSLYWGSSSDGTDGECSDSTAPAAIQVIVVTRAPTPPNEIKSYRYVYDSCRSQRQNNFADAANGDFSLNGVTFKHKTPTDNFAGSITNIVLMRVIPIYKKAVIGIRADPGLPNQGYRIDSTGTSGQANRKVRVFKGWPQTYLPYLSYGLFVAKDL